MPNRMLIIPLLIACLILPTCSSQPRAALPDDQVQRTAENVMAAINEQDYRAFTANFGDKLKDAFTEEGFIDLSETILSSSGRFQRITGSRVARAQTQGYVTYIYSCAHENETLSLSMVYEIDGEKIEGIFFNGKLLNEAFQAKQQ
jgi:hypothetical protein